MTLGKVIGNEQRKVTGETEQQGVTTDVVQLLHLCCSTTIYNVQRLGDFEGAT